MNRNSVTLLLLCFVLYGCWCSPFCSPFPLFFPVDRHDGEFIDNKTLEMPPKYICSECEGKAIAASVSSKAKSFDQFFRETGLNWFEAHEKYPLMFQLYGKCMYEKGYFYNVSVHDCLSSPEKCRNYAKFRKWYWWFWTY